MQMRVKLLIYLQLVWNDLRMSRTGPCSEFWIGMINVGRVVYVYYFISSVTNLKFCRRRRWCTKFVLSQATLTHCIRVCSETYKYFDLPFCHPVGLYS